MFYCFYWERTSIVDELEVNATEFLFDTRATWAFDDTEYCGKSLAWITNKFSKKKRMISSQNFFLHSSFRDHIILKVFSSFEHLFLENYNNKKRFECKKTNSNTKKTVLSPGKKHFKFKNIHKHILKYAKINKKTENNKNRQKRRTS